MGDGAILIKLRGKGLPLRSHRLHDLTIHDCLKVWTQMIFAQDKQP